MCGDDPSDCCCTPDFSTCCAVPNGPSPLDGGWRWYGAFGGCNGAVPGPCACGWDGGANADGDPKPGCLPRWAWRCTVSLLPSWFFWTLGFVCAFGLGVAWAVLTYDPSFSPSNTASAPRLGYSALTFLGLGVLIWLLDEDRCAACAWACARGTTDEGWSEPTGKPTPLRSSSLRNEAAGRGDDGPREIGGRDGGRTPTTRAEVERESRDSFDMMRV